MLNVYLFNHLSLILTYLVSSMLSKQTMLITSIIFCFFICRSLVVAQTLRAVLAGLRCLLNLEASVLTNPRPLMNFKPGGRGVGIGVKNIGPGVVKGFGVSGIGVVVVPPRGVEVAAGVADLGPAGVDAVLATFGLAVALGLLVVGFGVAL